MALAGTSLSDLLIPLWTFYVCSLFRSAILEEAAMWDTVRVDHGKEFVLTLFMQDINAHNRKDLTRSSYIQSTSKEVTS
jgi:hypothetical protein